MTKEEIKQEHNQTVFSLIEDETSFRTIIKGPQVFLIHLFIKMIENEEKDDIKNGTKILLNAVNILLSAGVLDIETTIEGKEIISTIYKTKTPVRECFEKAVLEDMEKLLQKMAKELDSNPNKKE